MTVFDFDDHCETNDAMVFMHQLKAVNPQFKATLFAIPALGNDAFWDNHPDWIELAMHGWAHPNPYEAAGWSYDQACDVLLSAPAAFMNGWKSPGWQISDGTYQALLDLGWWVADQHLEDGRRPAGLPVYLYEDDDCWHGHVQNVCGNGILETWDALCAKVAATTDFQFASEAVKVAVA